MTPAAPKEGSMPTADREELAEKLAEAIRRQVVLLRFDEATTLDSQFHPHEIELLCIRSANAVLDSGLVADAAAQADTAAQAVAERDEAVVRANEEETAAAFDRAMRTVAENRVARLSAEAEALRAERDETRAHLPEGLRDTSLAGAVQALAFSASTENTSKWRWGHALTIGLAFADRAAGEEWEHGDMASIDVCYAMAAILKCDCDGDTWHELVKAGAARLAEYRALAAGQDKTEGGGP